MDEHGLGFAIASRAQAIRQDDLDAPSATRAATPIGSEVSWSRYLNPTPDRAVSSPSAVPAWTFPVPSTEIVAPLSSFIQTLVQGDVTDPRSLRLPECPFRSSRSDCRGEAIANVQFRQRPGSMSPSASSASACSACSMRRLPSKANGLVTTATAPRSLGMICYNLALVHVARRNWPEARACLEEAIAYGDNAARDLYARLGR